MQSVSERPARIQAAISELSGLIRARFPTAGFVVEQGEDPEGVYVIATVDIDDIDQVVDLYIDRMIDIQVKDGLPVYVVTVRPLSRIAADRAEPDPDRPAAVSRLN